METQISDSSKLTMQEIETIQKGISHRPFNKNSEQHQRFLNLLLQCVAKNCIFDL